MKRKKTRLLLALMIISPFIFNSCGEPDKNIYPVKMGDKWGYVNAKGQYVVNPMMDEADCFKCGLARVVYQGKVGYIDPSGKFKISPDFIAGTSFVEDVAFVTFPGESPSCIDKNGRILFTLDKAEVCTFFSEGLSFFITSDLLFGYIDKKGNVVIEPKYTVASVFKNGRAAVEINDKKGYINKKGEMVIDAQYDDCSDFSEGFAAVKIGKEWGYINVKGDLVISPQFDACSPFSEGVAMVQVGESKGYIDSDGKFVINPQFDRAFSFKNGMAAVTTFNGHSGKGSGFGFIDKSGKIVVNPIYDKITDFQGNCAFVSDMESDKYGIINKKGELVVSSQFDKVKEWDESSIFIQSNYYDADQFLNSFFAKYGDAAQYGFSGNSILADVKAKHSLSKGPTDSTVAFVFDKPEMVNDASVRQIVFCFDQKTFSLVDNYVSGWFGIGKYRDGYKRSYINSCKLKGLEYHFLLEGIAEGKTASLAKSIASKLSQKSGSEIKENGSTYLLPGIEGVSEYAISYNQKETMLKVVFSE